MNDWFLVGVSGFSSLMFIAIGIGMLRANETKPSCFQKAKATIISRGSGEYSYISPVVEFRDGLREVTTRMIYEIPDKPEYREGSKLDILYCPKKVLFGLHTQSVVLDDGGESVRRIGRSYLLSGAVFATVGVVLIFATLALAKSWFG